MSFSSSHESSPSSGRITTCPHHIPGKSEVFVCCSSAGWGSSTTGFCRSVGSSGAEPNGSSSPVGYSVDIQVSTVSPDFLSLLIDGKAKTATQHANAATHTPINNHILLLPPDTGVFCGEAFELSAYCGLVNNSESRI